MGHAGGISTLLIPGAGEPNYDSRVADPFQGRKARREQEVHRLLDKLQPEMIVLDPDTIGQVGARQLRGSRADLCCLGAACLQEQAVRVPSGGNSQKTSVWGHWTA